MSAKRKHKLTRPLTPRWKPRPYQKLCFEEGLRKNYLALFLDPGLGKTSILLQIFNKRKLRKQTKAVLIVAPLNPCYMTWPEEIKGWTNFRRFKYTILHGPGKDLALKKRGVDIYIINPEGLKWLMQKLKGKPKKSWPFDMLIVDESSKFKTPGGPNTGSHRTWLINRLAPGFKYRYIANGTPVANGYLGLMSQMSIIDQGQSLGTKISYYREKYFDQVGRPEWRQYELSKGADKKILKKIAPFAICLKAEDYVYMPKRIVLEKFIHLPKRAMKAYSEIESELFTLIDNKELVAESASSLSNKLHQICNGAIYEDQDPLGKPLPSSKRQVIELHKEKLYIIENLIEEFNGRPILIGYKFQHDKKILQQYFKKRIKFFDDAKTGPQKVKLQKNWNNNKIPLLAGNPQSVGHGLNLQKGSADVVVFYSLDHDYDTHDQFLRRLLRSGNKAKQVFLCYIMAKGLYDHQAIYPTLIKRKKVQDSFAKRLIDYRNRCKPL